MNNNASLEAFAADVYTEIKERYEESQSEMKEHKDDSFVSGRALAFNEAFEIIKSRLDIYGIKKEA